MPRFQRLDLASFGIGVLSGLTLSGVTILDDSDERKLNRSFLAAYKVVEENFEKENLRFRLILDQMHGTSPDVHAIMLWWLRFWATKDDPGSTWRLGMPEEAALNYTEHNLPGGKKLWLQAARAFMDEYQSV